MNRFSQEKQIRKTEEIVIVLGEQFLSFVIRIYLLAETVVSIK